MTSEFDRIRAIQARVERTREEVILGIGDDAAVIRERGAPTVLSVDAAVEGVHFRRGWLSAAELGARAFETAASDLAAMGATVDHALVALGVPRDVDDGYLLALMDGYAAVGDSHGAAVIGGNLTRGPVLTLTTTVLGRASPRVLGRAGAVVGDSLYVTGPLGAASLGLRALDARITGGDAERFVAKWRGPRARVAEGIALAPFAHACIDLSDGLAQDLGHLCAASKVGARIEEARLPRLEGHEAFARTVGASSIDSLLGGGEEYELLFALAANVTPPPWATYIGVTTSAEEGLILLDASGKARPLASQGFDHFVASGARRARV